MKPKIITRWTTRRSRFDASCGNKTRSEFRDDCDIRNIIKRHSLAPTSAPLYLDLTGLPDGVQGTLELARRVASGFDSLPLKARQYFNYDVEKLSQFLLDPNNKSMAAELGLLPPTATASSSKPPDTSES